MNGKRVRVILRILLILLIFATVAHAFYQSSLPVNESAEVSDKVGEIIEEIIPPETSAGQLVQKNIRKLAHFTEFAFLGLWASLYALFFMKRKNALVAILPFGLITATLDETVQIFSKRGPSVKDIWIDMAGYSFSALTVFSVFFAATLVAFFVKRHRQS